MSPWALDKLAANPEERDRLLARAEAMGVRLGALYATRTREWHVSAAGHGLRVSLRAHGPLVVALEGVMDDFAEATVGTAWTANELLTVAAQSGIAVRRA